MPVILGPTGIGKSRAAFELARRLGGEIVVADSRQVYRLLDIATNKPSPEELGAVPHHLVGVCDPHRVFSLHDFLTAAGAAIDGIHARGRTAIVEGGTMLYVDALLEGYSLGGVPPRPERRAELDALGLDELVLLLRELDPTADVDLRNRVRLVRAVEMLEAAGPPLAGLRTRTPPAWTPLRLGLTASPATIDARLAARSRRQVERGLVEETARALASGVPRDAPVMTGIGYAEAIAHLDGRVALSDLPDLMARNNRRFARRQLRWLRRDRRVRWVVAEVDPVPELLGVLWESGVGRD